MSEPIISKSPKPDSGDELNVDPHPVPTPRCRTKHQENISALDGEVEEMPHADSEQPERIRAVPIHQRPDLLVPCADLVNSEWQRSQAARVHSLQKSCSEFPVCLVLLQGHRGTERLLGHARLSRVIGHSSLFIESVVVSKEERGRGYGRTLMEETERYAKRRGFKRLCLTTHDKQQFYAHLGYVLSTPVQSTGAVMAFVPVEMLKRLSRFPNEEASTRKQTLTQTDAQVSQDNRDSGSAYVVGSSPSFSLPPPPPPPPSMPHPPPPPQSAEQLVVQTLTETPYRDAKGVPIFWMRKDI